MSSSNSVQLYERWILLERPMPPATEIRRTVAFIEEWFDVIAHEYLLAWPGSAEDFVEVLPRIQRLALAGGRRQWPWWLRDWFRQSVAPLANESIEKRLPKWISKAREHKLARLAKAKPCFHRSS